jgi:parallel beta-helix repeat protein
MFKKKLFYLLLIIGLHIPTMAQSATYYVSSVSGNDANDGLSENSPWQTINKINEFEFQDNDSILFKRGEIFRGAISLKKSPIGITFSAYGSGDKPILAGSVQITGWTKTSHPALDSSVVYEADVSGLPLSENGIEHLFVDGELMTIARYPNVDSPNQTNWLKVGATSGKTGFTDPNLATYGKPNSYWNGATLRIRDYSWTYTITEVTSYTASNGKITANRLSNQLPEWGYFLDDKLEELDNPGEWYHDVETQTVYLYPKEDFDFNTDLIEGSTFQVGITISNGKNDTLIENLTFLHFTEKGVYISGSNNCIVRNNHFEHNVQGASAWNSPNVLITNNTFDNQLHSSIGLQNSSDFDVQDSLVEKNLVTNTALYPLYGVRYDGVYQGIGIGTGGKAYTVRQNTVKNSSHAGITAQADGQHLIENNEVRNAMLLLNDGGAIVIRSDGNQIIGNFFFDSVGNVDESNGCAHVNTLPCPHHHSYGMGIGANNTLKDNVIEGNTVANNAHEGIRLNSFTNSTARNNIVYNNQKNQIVLEDIYGSKRSKDNVVEGNIFYALAPTQIGIKLTNKTNHGTINNNFYCNPFSEIALQRDKKNYSLGFWQQEFSTLDNNSRWCDNLPALQEYSVSNVNAELINSTFDTEVSNWKGASVTHDTTQTQMDGGSLKAVYSGSGNSNVISNAFILTTGQSYRLKFSVIGNGFGTILLRINNTDADNRAILKENFVAYDQTRQDYEMFFQSSVTTDAGKILFITTKDDADTYWLDNVTFEPVDAVLNDPTEKVALFTNINENARTLYLGKATYYDINNNRVPSDTVIEPFSSQILILEGEADNQPNPSQATFRNGDNLRVSLPSLPEGQVSYFGFALDNAPNLIYVYPTFDDAPQIIDLNAFDNNQPLPIWEGGDIIEFPVNSDFPPKDNYTLYFLRSPIDSNPLSNLDQLGISTFQIN